jgi:hypothetical protein
MNRHYYISDNLEDLERVEIELMEQGVGSPQLHVFSGEDTTVDADAHHLHEVSDFSKRDVVHSGFVGFCVGLIGAVVVLGVFYFMGWSNSVVGWMPAIFLAVIILGFSTWEGGLRGIQVPNHEFKKFQEILNQGKHIFFVDVDPAQENILKDVVLNHPQLEFVGDGHAAPSWIVHAQSQFLKFIKSMP